MMRNFKTGFMSVTLGALLAMGCAKSINPVTQARTNELIQSAHGGKNVSAPSSYEPKPWKAGQWVLYRTTGADMEQQVQKMKVVAETSEGIWIETENWDYYGHSVSKVLYARQPTSADETAEMALRMVSRQDNQEAQTLDFQNGPMAGLMKATMKHVFSGVVADTDVSAAPREAISVPAGSFDGAARFNGSFQFGPVKREVTGWFHPEVPLSGSVKSVDSEGKFSSELLDWGDTGAESIL